MSFGGFTVVAHENDELQLEVEWAMWGTDKREQVRFDLRPQAQLTIPEWANSASLIVSGHMHGRIGFELRGRELLSYELGQVNTRRLQFCNLLLGANDKWLVIAVGRELMD